MEIEKYSVEALQTVTGAGFLVPTDWNALAEMQDELQDTFEKQQVWRTETEIRVSVLNDTKKPTKAAKYWQCIKEQAVFFDNLVQLSFDYRRNDLEIRRFKKKLVEEKDTIEQESLAIDIEEAEYKRKGMQLAAKDRLRELKLWSKIKKELNDGTFDDKDVNTDQLETMRLAYNMESEIAKHSTNISPSEARNVYSRTIQVNKMVKQLEE